jgi:hypothetical protein
VKVIMKTRIAGSRNGVRWPEAGAVVDLPDNEGADLCAAGLADPVAEKDEPEKRPAKKAEKRA